MDALITDSNACYIDGTLGCAGHSRHVLKRLSSQGRLLGIDKDPAAMIRAERYLDGDIRFVGISGSFSQLQQLYQSSGFSAPVAGVLLDLGVSSPQLDLAERGFSFLRDGPLDMRMNNRAGLSAAQWIAQVSEAELIDVLRTYGEERFAKHLARAIVRARVKVPITRTGQLAEIIKEAHPRWELHKHPATRAFQAIRIVVNDELDDLRQGLQQALEVLMPGGRLVVISFHSLEDRIVKQFIQQQATGGDWPKGFPIQESQLKKRLKKVGPAVKASAAEVGRNPRARSAIMRVAEKIM